jgi:hypothetical protein
MVAHVALGAGPVLAHQGGWDEILMVLTPVALFAALLWLANSRASRIQADRTSPAGTATSADDADDAPDAPPSDQADADGDDGAPPPPADGP